MNKFMRISMRVLMALVAIYITMLVLLFVFVKPETYKPIITEQVQQHTGMKLIIDGKIKLMFFPWPGIKVTNLQLNNPQGYTAPETTPPYFARIGAADIRVGLLPLFRGKVEPRWLVLRNLHLNLVTNEQGQTNWHTLANGTSPPSVTPPSTTTPSTSATSTTAAISMPTIAIKNANITWIDQPAHQTISLQKFYFMLTPHESTHEAKIEAHFTLNNDNPMVRMNINANTIVMIDPSQKIFDLSEFDFNGNIVAIDKKLSEAIPFKLKAAKLHLDTQAPSVFIQKLDGKLANLRITGNMESQQKHDVAITRGTINIPQFDARELIKLLHLRYQPSDSDALAKVAMDMQIENYNHVVRISKLQMQLDQSKIVGSLMLTYSEHPKLNFLLQINALDLDHYEPAMQTPLFGSSTSTATTPAAIKPSKAPNSDKPVFADTLKNWQWDGQLTIGEIDLHNFVTKNVEIKTQAQQGKISIAPITATVDDGKIDMDAQLDVTESTPKLATRIAITNVPLAVLLRPMLSKQFLQGALTLHSQLRTSGNTTMAWRSNLNGQGQLFVKDGVVRGVNLSTLVDTGTAFLRKQQSSPSETKSNLTDFSTLSASFTIKNGMLANPDLMLDSNELLARGNGVLDLQNLTYQNYQLSAYYRDTPDFVIPIILSGPLANPSYKVNYEELGKGVVKGVIKKGIDLLPAHPLNTLKNLLP